MAPPIVKKDRRFVDADPECVRGGGSEPVRERVGERPDVDLTPVKCGELVFATLASQLGEKRRLGARRDVRLPGGQRSIDGV
jgi:hypothetical protein